MTAEHNQPLSSDQLAQLLAVAGDEETRSVDLDGQIAAALDELLSCRTDLLGLDDPRQQRSVLALLVDPNVSLAQLELAKGISRRMVASGDCDVDQAVGTALWYAAMAAALVSDQPVRSRMAPDELARGMDEMLDKKWLNDRLKDLLTRARKQLGPVGRYQPERT
ncbi:MAG: hypothetical protein ACLFUJ_10640 [Phycisphaerae bacterium]